MYYHVFLSNKELLIFPLVTLLPNITNPTLITTINRTLFNILYTVPITQSEVFHIPQIIETIVNSYMNLFNHLLQTSNPTIFLYLNKFAKSYKIMTSFDHWDPNSIVSNTFKLLYQQIFVLLNPLWTNPQQETVVSSLCEFLMLCIDSRIVSNQNEILEWIGVSLHQTPVHSHFDLLKKLDQFLPSNNVMLFLQNVNNVNDSQIIFDSLCFIKHLFEISKWENFINFFTIEYILQFLNVFDQRIVSETLAILRRIMEIFPQNLIMNSINLIIGSLIKGVFVAFDEDVLRNALQLLMDIIKVGICNVEDMVKIAVNYLGIDEKEAMILNEILSGNSLNETRILAMIKRLIITHKEEPI